MVVALTPLAFCACLSGTVGFESRCGVAGIPHHKSFTCKSILGCLQVVS